MMLMILLEILGLGNLVAIGLLGALGLCFIACLVAEALLAEKKSIKGEDD